jgi:dipeptidase E
VLLCPLIFPGFKVNGIHTSKDPVQAVKQAEAFYVGGGNTFQLLKALYDWNLIDPIRKHVLEVIFML